MFDVGPAGASARVGIVAPSSDALDRPLGAARAQVHDNYIVSQTRDGLVIVDQHAAHERLVYERLKAAVERDGVARQILLIPEIVEMGRDRRRTAVVARRTNSRHYGLVLEGFGPGAVAVRETPSLLGEIDAGALVRDLAEHMRGMGRRAAARTPSVARLRHHGVPRLGAVGAAVERRGNECASARDGGHAQFRAMQSRPPDLCEAQSQPDSTAVRRK